MREARIILIANQLNPSYKPYSLLGEQTIGKIIKAFGGATVANASGWWAGTVENVLTVDIAYAPTNDNDLKLYDIADQYRLNAEQEAVYLRYGNGHVQMVTAKSCMDNGEFDWETLRKEIREPEDDIGDIVPDTSHLVTI